MNWCILELTQPIGSCIDSEYLSVSSAYWVLCNSTDCSVSLENLWQTVDSYHSRYLGFCIILNIYQNVRQMSNLNNFFYVKKNLNYFYYQILILYTVPIWESKTAVFILNMILILLEPFILFDFLCQTAVLQFETKHMILVWN